MPTQEQEQFVPEGLADGQYAAHLLEEILSMPATRSNLELMIDCLKSIQRSKKLTGLKAYKCMARAIRLAKGQQIKTDITWLRNGDYAHIRPDPPIPNTSSCDPECAKRHDQGYGENDVKFVWKKYQDEVAAGGKRTPWDFFDELDTRREDGPPVWR